ncbi:twin-arginine translocation signal domain-containing protein [Halorussus halophilus]|uniref:twin-arginine translocation signal domain-containing protein n=1 Tax=Halorussus halophilus TaxID=2650975 RepID=UPI001CE4A397|nr:twin-arginine translocation signal domain-containing protein [Halorussus halophilus]
MTTTDTTDPTDSDRSTAETDDTRAGDSRRSFLKTGALAAGGLALGASSTDIGAAQNAQQALVYAYEYHPATNFRVEDELPAATTVRLLRLPGGNTVPEISQPDDYNGYVIRYEMGNPRAAISTFLFTRRNLQRDQRYRLSASAQVFSSELNVLGATFRRRN